MSIRRYKVPAVLTILQRGDSLSGFYHFCTAGLIMENQNDFDAESYYRFLAHSLDHILASRQPYAEVDSRFEAFEKETLANPAIPPDVRLETRRRVAECRFTAAVAKNATHHQVVTAFRQRCELEFANNYLKRYFHNFFATYLYSIKHYEDCITILEPISAEAQKEVDAGNDIMQVQLTEINQLLRQAKEHLGMPVANQSKSTMPIPREKVEQQFTCLDPVKDASVSVQVFETTTSNDPWSEYRTVRIKLEDGRIYESTCWRDPMQRGGSWVEEPGMVIVQDLTLEHIQEAIETIVAQNEIDSAFELLSD